MSQVNSNLRIRCSRTTRLVPLALDFPQRATSGTEVTYVTRFVLTAAPLLLGDLLAVGLSCAVASLVTALIFPNTLPATQTTTIMLGILSVYAVLNLYPGTGLSPVAELRRIILATGLPLVVLVVSAVLQRASAATVSTLVIAHFGAIIWVPMVRSASRRVSARFPWWGQKLLVFGNNNTAKRLYDHYRLQPWLGFRPSLITDGWLVGAATDGSAVAAIRSERLRSIRNEYRGFWAAVVVPAIGSSSSLVEDYLSVFPRLFVVPDGVRSFASCQHAIGSSGSGVIFLRNQLLIFLPRLGKMLADYLLAAAIGLLCLPLIGIISVVIKLTSPGPIFYSQKRIGRNNQPFWAWKFRTMLIDADEVLQNCLDGDAKLREEWERGHKLKEDPRVTGVGSFLRTTSLDELPQLWNILRGEMSLVGPRPIVAAEIAKYRDSFDFYTRVTPGITGLWQISGRSDTTYEERVELDTQYVLNWSLWLDLFILTKTIRVVLLRDGAY